MSTWYFLRSGKEASLSSYPVARRTTPPFCIYECKKLISSSVNALVGALRSNSLLCRIVSLENQQKKIGRVMSKPLLDEFDILLNG